MGYLLLEGGAEFGGRMRDPDLKAIDLAGGFGAAIRILPTAAAPDHNHVRAGRNGIRWFQSLGASDVISLPLIDQKSANDRQVAEWLRNAALIYILGGFTHYLGQTLKESWAWQAILDAYQKGGVIAGSSAGAMVMCGYYYDPGADQIHPGLNLVPNALVLPHHNTFGRSWALPLIKRIPDATLIGIDEETGMLDDGAHTWTVHGRGSVTLYARNAQIAFPAGNSFSL